MFSKTCEYGIRAMIFVAKTCERTKKIGIKEIAKGIVAPEHFIAKIMQELSRKGLIESTKGPNGGFYFEKEELNISIADIVKVLDGDQLFSGCALGLPECSGKEPCPIHFEFKKIREQIFALMQNTKILDFYENKDLKLNFLKTR